MRGSIRVWPQQRKQKDSKKIRKENDTPVPRLPSLQLARRDPDRRPRETAQGRPDRPLGLRAARDDAVRLSDRSARPGQQPRAVLARTALVPSVCIYLPTKSSRRR